MTLANQLEDLKDAAVAEALRLREASGKALTLLAGIRLTAHLHSFSEDQVKLVDEVIEDLRKVLYD